MNQFLLQHSDIENYSLRERFFAAGLFFTPIAISLNPKLGSITSGLLILSTLFLCWGKVKLDLTEKLFFLSVLFLIISLSLSIYESALLSDAISIIGKYGKLLFFIPFYMTLKRMSSSNFLFFIALGSALACFIGFYWAITDIYLENLPRASGGYHPIFFGTAMALYILTIASQIFKTKNYTSFLNIFFYCAIILGLYSCILSETRIAWLALVFAPSLAVFIKYNGKVKLSLIFLLSVLCLLIYKWLPDNTISIRTDQAIKEIKNQINHPKSCSSTGARYNMWRNSVLMIKDSPLLGVGLGDYGDASEKLIEGKKSFARCKLITQYTAHSNYFHILAESGVLGLSALLLMLSSLVVLAYFRGIESLTLIFAFIIFGVTTTWLAKNLSIHVFIIYSLIFLFSKAHKQANFSHKITE